MQGMMLSVTLWFMAFNYRFSPWPSEPLLISLWHPQSRRQIKRADVSLQNNTSWAHGGKSHSYVGGGCYRKLTRKLGANFTVDEHNDVWNGGTVGRKCRGNTKRHAIFQPPSWEAKADDKVLTRVWVCMCLCVWLSQIYRMKHWIHFNETCRMWSMDVHLQTMFGVSTLQDGYLSQLN